MFVLTELKDTVRIPPSSFKSKLNDVINDELNRKLANKVYKDVGLCITLHDITKIEESYIFPGDGASHTKVTFRFIVFRPWMEEILIGRIRSCSPEGVHVTLGFFEDIVIPPHKLQHPSRFDQMEQAWVWIYKTEDGKTHDLFMDAGEVIRFRVVKEIFTEAPLPSVLNASQDISEKAETNNAAPYILHGSIDEPGLGLLTWWQNA
ncbi:DNA-directed RNA polymerase III subunit RPC8 [Trachymyrmex septentrionalis]|uniref:DNA-directed RNA polymerase III subunit RPC8 n=1 Tax=Trachymyrmex septentrionalis TaxID=34720 RepID=A0A195FHW9_9HYME|nr:PREDICTED: DNA-directed RNA polymerase III subunit RPC8 [Trachymyrmex septentrionalis]KYN39973.1 DNA-directed RNA polymerase III subunit RPC8 [Trachymyrmex septentrionalis]